MTKYRGEWTGVPYEAEDSQDERTKANKAVIRASVKLMAERDAAMKKADAAQLIYNSREGWIERCGELESENKWLKECLAENGKSMCEMQNRISQLKAELEKRDHVIEHLKGGANEVVVPCTEAVAPIRQADLSGLDSALKKMYSGPPLKPLGFMNNPLFNPGVDVKKIKDGLEQAQKDKFTKALNEELSHAMRSMERSLMDFANLPSIIGQECGSPEQLSTPTCSKCESTDIRHYVGFTDEFDYCGKCNEKM